MTAVVSLKNVVKSYRRGKQRVEVLHALDLEVQAGEFLTLMGPSGSGKTTLLNLIGGIDRSDEGEIVVAGERISVLASRELARWRAWVISASCSSSTISHASRFSAEQPSSCRRF